VSSSLYRSISKHIAVYSLALSFAGSSAEALSLLSNLEPEDSFGSAVPFYNGRSLYQSFHTGSAAATIERITFQFNQRGTPYNISVSVYSDIAGKPGSLLDSFNSTSPYDLNSGNFGFFDFEPLEGLGVNANSDYWMVLSATGLLDSQGNPLPTGYYDYDTGNLVPGSDVNGAVTYSAYNFAGITGNLAETGMTGWTLANSYWYGNHLDSSPAGVTMAQPWEPTPVGGFSENVGVAIQMGIVGTSVPEPSTGCLLGLGALALIRRRSRA